MPLPSSGKARGKQSAAIRGFDVPRMVLLSVPRALFGFDNLVGLRMFLERQCDEDCSQVVTFSKKAGASNSAQQHSLEPCRTRIIIWLLYLQSHFPVVA